MGEFFRGWPRIAWVVTLVLAKIFAAGWIRSLGYLDTITVPTGERSFLHFISVRQGLEWDLLFHRFSADFISEFSHWNLYSKQLDAETWSTHISDYARNWRIVFLGFALGTGSRDGSGSDEHVSILRVPYWSIVLPLICVSAWLILHYSDRFFLLTVNESTLHINSDRQFLKWDQYSEVGPYIILHSSLVSERIDVGSSAEDFAERPNKWGVDFLGIVVGSGSHDVERPWGYRWFICRVPYWMIVLPLICASAWLILRRPPSAVGKPTAISRDRSTVEPIGVAKQ